MKRHGETTSWLAWSFSGGLLAAACQATVPPSGGDAGDGSVVAEASPGGGSQDAPSDSDASLGADATTSDGSSGDDARADATLADAAVADAMPADAGSAEAGLTDSPSGGDGSATACTATSTVCGGTCTDLASDPKNCGACGHDCLGGPCCRGWCQPTLFATTSATIQSIAVDSTNVYWSEVNNGPSGINECGLTAPCVTPTTLVSGDSATATKLVTDGTNVYWVGSSLFECAIAGCAGVPTALAPSTAGGSALAVDATRLYWSDGSSAGNVDECTLTGCAGTTTTLGFVGQPPGAIAVNAADVFWTTSDQIAECPVGGHCANNVGEVVGFPPVTQAGPIAVDSTDVYWSQDGVLLSCPLTGCAVPTTLAQNVALFTVALDSTNVYWGGMDGDILSCAKTGCAAPTIVVSGRSQIETTKTFALSANALYYVIQTPRGGLIARVAKPLPGSQAPAVASCRLTGSVTSIQFPSCTAGVSSQTVTITNGGPSSLSWNAALVDLPGEPSLAQNFSIAPADSTLAPMQSASITITPDMLSVSAEVFPFPSTNGAGELVITTGDGALPEEVYVDGTILPNIDFGSVPVHSTLEQLIPDFGQVAPAGSVWFFSSSNPAFTLSAPLSDSGFGANWAVVFSPITSGPQSATLEFGAPGAPVCPPNPIVLTGNGS